MNILLASILALTCVFSEDGVSVGSGERECPSQGFDRISRQTVVGLPSRTDEERARCGWYRVTPPEVTLASNQYFSVTGYVFSAGTARRVGVVKTRRSTVTVTRYSKLKIYETLAMLGKWQTVQSWLQSTEVDGVNLWMSWQQAQFISDDMECFLMGKNAAAQVLGLTAAEIDAYLAECVSERVVK